MCSGSVVSMRRFLIFLISLFLSTNSLFANGATELTSKERAEGREYEAEFSKITHKFVPLNDVVNSVKAKITDGTFTAPEYYTSEIRVTKENSADNPALIEDADSPIIMPTTYAHHRSKLRQYFKGAKGYDVYIISYMIAPIQVYGETKFYIYIGKAEHQMSSQ